MIFSLVESVLRILNLVLDNVGNNKVIEQTELEEKHILKVYFKLDKCGTAPLFDPQSRIHDNEIVITKHFSEGQHFTKGWENSVHLWRKEHRSAMQIWDTVTVTACIKARLVILKVASLRVTHEPHHSFLSSPNTGLLFSSIEKRKNHVKNGIKNPKTTCRWLQSADSTLTLTLTHTLFRFLLNFSTLVSSKLTYIFLSVYGSEHSIDQKTIAIIFIFLKGRLKNKQNRDKTS